MYSSLFKFFGYRRKYFADAYIKSRRLVVSL
jgi:hypothetical protein